MFSQVIYFINKTIKAKWFSNAIRKQFSGISIVKYAVADPSQKLRLGHPFTLLRGSEFPSPGHFSKRDKGLCDPRCSKEHVEVAALRKDIKDSTIVLIRVADNL